jgi:hypothetical protein
LLGCFVQEVNQNNDYMVQILIKLALVAHQ